MSPTTVTFKVNGRDVELASSPSRQLLDALRDDLGLTGTKRGCDGGECWSCAVLMDGKVTMSCRLPLEKAAERNVITIEGIGVPQNPHPIQTAFVQAGAVQCGFCTPGLIVSTKALLDRNLNPSSDEIVRKLSKHICRCTGYTKIVDAVRLAAETMRGVATPPVAAFGTVGANHSRVDAWEKVLGTAKFGADAAVENQLYARVLRSHHHHALVHSIDISEARKVPGVEGIFTAHDIPGTNRIGYVTRDQPVLVGDKVRRIGEAVAVVAARSEAAAGEALLKIKVEYEPLEAVLDPIAALAPEAPRVHQEGNLMCYRHVVRGDVEAGFESSAVVVEGSYSTPFAEHAYLEPEAGLAYVDELGRVVVESCTQNPVYIQHDIAHALGIELDRVRSIPTAIGGAFGGKLDATTQVLLALVAHKLRRPVKMVLSRVESFVASTKKHPFRIDLRLGATQEGKFVALYAKLVADGGAYASASTRVLSRAVIHSAGPYEIPNVSLEGVVAYTNNPTAGAMRGYGANQACFAIESLVDALARRLNVDPLELRALNTLDRGSTTITGHVIEQDIGIRHTIEAIRPYYEESKRWRDEPGAGSGILRGVGMACYCESLAQFPRGPEKEVAAAELHMEPGFGGGEPAEAEVELMRDGRVCVYSGSVELGQGSMTVLGQIAAEEMGLSTREVVVICGDTALTPPAGSTSASRTVFRSGYAVRSAARQLKSEIVNVGAAMLGCPAADVGMGDGFVFRATAKSNDRVSLVQIAQSRRQPMRCRGIQAHSNDPIFGIAGHTSNVQLAQVEVEARTGAVRVVRLVSAQDVGKAINPIGVEGQIEGGLVMGLGLALTEEFIPGSTAGFDDYLVPRLRDVPEIVPIIVEVPDEFGPFGAKGIGEQTLIATPPAITNAITDATGVPISRIPVRPSLLEEVAKRGTAL